MKKKTFGFTLMEMLITLAIGSILMMIGLPAYDTFIQRNQMTAAYNNLLGELAYARSEAVKQSAFVSICPSTNLFATPSCNSTDWSQGHLIFVDVDGDGDFEGGDTPLKTHEDSGSNISIFSAAFTDGGAITYNADGTINDTGTLFVCDPRGAAHAKGVNITVIGQIQPAYDGDSNGTIDDADGGEVTCS